MIITGRHSGISTGFVYHAYKEYNNIMFTKQIIKKKNISVIF
jgi:uncharacterized protein YllA (UPF0747 family)